MDHLAGDRCTLNGCVPPSSKLRDRNTYKCTDVYFNLEFLRNCGLSIAGNFTEIEANFPMDLSIKVSLPWKLLELGLLNLYSSSEFF